MRNKKGFTLLEVITAIAVVAIISGPLLQIFVTATKVGRESFDIDHANAAAVAVVEGISKGDTDKAINTVNYSMSNYESGGTNYTEYTATRYYNASWESVLSASESTFSAEVTLTGEDIESSSVETSYIPELQNSSGESYRMTADYSLMSSGLCMLSVKRNSGSYEINSGSQTILKTSATDSAHSSLLIPQSDCVYDIIPVIVDVGAVPLKNVSFAVKNLTGAEVAFYVYGDYSASPTYIHYVSVDDTPALNAGTTSINYMQTENSSLCYRNLDAEVKIIRNDTGKTLVDYGAKVYVIS